jgi:hypothetical protein
LVLTHPTDLQIVEEVERRNALEISREFVAEISISEGTSFTRVSAANS